MEVKMAMCPNGHYYNATLHATCPMCGASASNNVRRTASASAAPTGDPSNIGRTMPADAAGRNGSSGVGKTMPANGSGVTIPVTPNTDGGGRFGPTELADTMPGGIDPVVGWLVCIEGATKGQEYRIHSGYNYIGRETGDIRITGDMQISREKNAMIAYYAGNHSYYFGREEGRNIVLVNGKPVFSEVELHNFDVISIGASKLMFIGLCGERFSWEKGVTGGND